MTREQFKQAAGLTDALADRWYEPFMQTCHEFMIDTLTRQACFLAQIGTESGGFTQLIESFNYSVKGLVIFGPRLTAEQRATLGRKPGEPSLPQERQRAIANLVYGGRLGNSHPDDGWTYRGRGLKQITFKANYQACGKALGLDLLANPDLLLLESNAARSAGWFWQEHHLSKFADRGDFTGMTKAINGGLNGLEDRLARLQVARKALGLA
ncbi:glycoside hydrolase family 19 protein [Nissabacter sp. SGAir0207]|uniref:glycoside hydrolase family 19 protein n=1 Tax=Nissabacter sp. SGAir0207 TaxID=2126321 RepID=UPI0010CCF55C|nr:glycoside hydrolase family 19 protein [Nissabacter sp. SGAir0207]QCR36487.1 endolysin [Nissabacter sp. SGAir0207]